MGGREGSSEQANGSGAASLALSLSRSWRVAINKKLIKSVSGQPTGEREGREGEYFVGMSAERKEAGMATATRLFSELVGLQSLPRSTLSKNGKGRKGIGGGGGRAVDRRFDG